MAGINDYLKERLRAFSRSFPIRGRSFALPLTSSPLLDADESRIGFLISASAAANVIVLEVPLRTGTVDLFVSFTQSLIQRFNIDSEYGLVSLPLKGRSVGGPVTITIVELLFRG